MQGAHTACSLAHKPSHGQSTTPHGQPQPQRGRGACHWRLCLRRRQTLVRHCRHCLHNLHCRICLHRGHRQTSVQHCHCHCHCRHPQHWHRQPHCRHTDILIHNTRTFNAAWASSSLANGRLHCHRSSPTLPTLVLPASLTGIGFTMREAMLSIGWRPDPPPPPEAAHLDYAASLTLPTLPATPPRSATPNQGLPTSTSSELPQRSSPTSAPSMPYGRPFRQHRHRHRRRDKIIAGTQKTTLPKSAPSMPYGRPFRQHLHHHRRRDTLITDTRKTSSPTSVSSMPYGRPCRQPLHRQLSSTHGTTPDGLYHRWRQRLGPHHRHELLQPYHFVHGAFLKTLAKLATVLVGEGVNTRLVPFRSLTSLQRSAGSL